MYPKATLLVFICLCLYVHACKAQIPFKQQSYLDLRVHYIKDNNRNNYKWLNPDQGKDAFLYLSEINVQHCNCPVDLSKGLGIFKSFTLVGRWFNLLGEFASNPGMIYEYEDDFSFNEKGVKYIINKQQLAKYPPLLKRLKYAAPTAMDYTLRLNARDKQGNVSGLDLMVKDADLLIPPEKEMPYMVPGAPSKWSDRIVIGDYINQDETENKKRWADLVEVSDQVRLNINSLSIPVDELIAIATLYKHYEKDDKDLKENFKMLEPDFKPPTLTTPYAKSDEWSKPYEAEVRTATAYRDNSKVGLSSGGKIVFESDKYLSADSLPGSSKYFRFGNRNAPRGYELLNAKGRKLTVGGYDNFWGIVTSKEGDLYEFIGSIDISKAPVYKTLWKYYSIYRDDWRPPNALTAQEFENRTRIDRKYFQEDDGSTPNVDDAIKRSWKYFFIYEVPVVTTDKDLKIIKTEIRYLGTYKD